MKKISNQSQLDTDIEKRRYDTTIERPPRLDLRRDHAPVRDGGNLEEVQKRKDLGGTSVYQPKLKTDKKKPVKAQKNSEAVRFMHGFEPKKENLQKLLSIEAKLDVTLKFLSSAMAEFASLKSIDISPDGKLGGRGFAMDISEIRNRLYASVDSVSMVIDALYDETRGEHWKQPWQQKEEESQDQVSENVEESEGKVASILQRVIKKANSKKG